MQRNALVGAVWLSAAFVNVHADESHHLSADAIRLSFEGFADKSFDHNVGGYRRKMYVKYQETSLEDDMDVEASIFVKKTNNITTCGLVYYFSSDIMTITALYPDETRFSDDLQDAMLQGVYTPRTTCLELGKPASPEGFSADFCLPFAGDPSRTGPYYPLKSISLYTKTVLMWDHMDQVHDTDSEYRTKDGTVVEPTNSSAWGSTIQYFMGVRPGPDGETLSCGERFIAGQAVGGLMAETAHYFVRHWFVQNVPTFSVGAAGAREDRDLSILADTICAGALYVVAGQGSLFASADPIISNPNLLVEGTGFSGSAIHLTSQWDGGVKVKNEGCLDSKNYPMRSYFSSTYLCKKIGNPALCAVLGPALLPGLGPLGLFWAYLVGHLQVPFAHSIDESTYSIDVLELTVAHVCRILSYITGLISSDPQYFGGLLLDKTVMIPLRALHKVFFRG